jgi:hypothetical protein
VTRLSQIQSNLKCKLDKDQIVQLEAEVRQFGELYDAPERPLLKSIQVEQNLQDKFDQFVNALYQEFTLRIEECRRGPAIQQCKEQSFGESLSSHTNKTVNFIFEKNKIRVGKKLDALQSYIQEES